jgi:putative heme transporter
MELSSTITRRTGLHALVAELAPAAPAGTRRGRLLPLAWLAAGGLLLLLLARNGGGFLHALEHALRGGWQLVVLGALLEAGSLAGYVALQHRVIGRADRRIRARDSYDIALAGTAATRMLPTAGLGGAGVTVWALKARGLRAGEIAEHLLAFMLLLYAVYMAALFGFGIAVGSGLAHVSHGGALGLVAAALAASLTAAVVMLLATPSPIRRILSRLAARPRLAPLAARADEHLPLLRAALRRAAGELRRPHPALLGALAWWAFDIGVLAAMLHAFGAGLPLPALVLAYFLGTMFNVLPLPGSLSGGLAGTLVVFGAPAAPALAAVLAYRTIAVWLPAASGIASLFALRATVSRWRGEPVRG